MIDLFQTLNMFVEENNPSHKIKPLFSRPSKIRNQDPVRRRFANKGGCDDPEEAGDSGFRMKGRFKVGYLEVLAGGSLPPNEGHRYCHSRFCSV